MREKLLSISSGRSTSRKIEDFYTVENEIGRGALSIVYRGVQVSTGKHFAIKKIPLQSLRSVDLESVRREAEICSSMDHHGVCHLLDLFVSPTEICLIFDLMAAGDLFEVVKKCGSLCESEASRVVGQLLDALDYIHTAGYVHRDIKLENILCQNQADGLCCKISDFGFAKRALEPSSIEEACGTPQYVSPEILQGLDYGTEVDVWSLGVLTFTILGGYLPFYARNMDSLFRSIINGDYIFHSDFWGHISSDAKDFVSCMLQVDRSRRSSIKDLRQHPWIRKHARAAPICTIPSLSINVKQDELRNPAMASRVETVSATAALLQRCVMSNRRGGKSHSASSLLQQEASPRRGIIAAPQSQ